MSGYRFERADGELDCDAWRALDRAVYRWVRSHGGDALLAGVAAWTSLAEGQGDAALSLRAPRYGMAPLDAAHLAALRDSPWVATRPEHGQRPFALDAAGRFQLWRNHAHELAIARHVQARRAGAPSAAPAAPASEADLDALFGNDRSAAVQPQRAAVRGVLGRRLFVLTGGPGTGKTTTVLRMLLMLQRHAATPLKLRLAAPTGKAAQRLAQALRDGNATLRAGTTAVADAWWPLLDAMAGIETLTVHRLLGFQPWRNAFARGAGDPLDADVVVIDEASMVDLGMLRSLCDALRPEACLILVGDADQLTSVATGSVLADLVAVLEDDARGDLVRLEHSFRAEQGLAAVNALVRAGDGAALRRAAADGTVLRQRVIGDERSLRGALREWAVELAAEPALRPVLDAGAAAGDAVTAARVRGALGALARRQLLCALRETAFGSIVANACIEAQLRAAWQVDPQATWYAGRAVMVTRNDHAAGLFNGDVGICLADAAGRLRAWFDTARDGVAGVRALAIRDLPAHEGAFAITIHKSQGSEYERVAVLLPTVADHRILSRQLLYTGFTRARREVELWANDGVLTAALRQVLERNGGLADKLVQTAA